MPALSKAITQQIFPGAHSDVGGGYQESGLSDCALQWMADRVNAVQNLFDLTQTSRPIAASPLAPAHDESKVFPYLATPHHARAFPHIATASDALIQRLHHEVDVLPGSSHEPYSPQGRYADGSALTG
jgi:hypothetical protein